MRFPYLPLPTRRPVPSLGGRQFRFRPVLPVRLFGPNGSRVYDGCLDSASDDTIFPQALARVLGIGLDGAPLGQARPVGGLAIPYRYAKLTLAVSDGHDRCEWEAMVGFADIPLRGALLGHAGFLEYFDTELRGNRREAILTPNPSFSGKRTVFPPTQP